MTALSARPAQRRRRGGVALAALAALVFGSLGTAAASAPAAAADEAPTTWGHDNAIATTGPIADDQVRQSPFYSASVASAADPAAGNDSFVYLSVPRSGNGKIGYTEQDGAEFAADAGLSMSWSSFEYSADATVDVSLTTGQTIDSVDQVTIRPTDLGLHTELVDDTTVRVTVPYSEGGYRFSVEFDPQLFTAYNDMSDASGLLTTEAEGNRAVHTEPRNSLMVFANAAPDQAETERTIPTEADGSIHRPAEGRVNDLNDISEEIIYFEPGVYDMGSDYHAVLPANVRWVYLAPGAYVKGAFRFADNTQPHYKVTGLGVLSGEQYVYEPDTTNGYEHNVNENCHSDCVKMLQFESSDDAQQLELQGVTIANPPYHSFVVYQHDDIGEVLVTDFTMTVDDYKQVGSWYWQTDGIELYPGGRMSDTFFHANDDVLKMYHDDVQIQNTVIWKNENGPVVQWGWGPREIDGVSVTNTDVIHNRMYWKDVKYNTCVFNSSTHWEDMSATDRADPTQTVRNMTFTDTRVEGKVNCAVRLFAMANTENITIDGLDIDEWNDLDPSSQASKFSTFTNSAGERVTLGDEMTEGNGLLLNNYRVGGETILKAGDNWASTELGRLDFDADTWDSWNATGDDAPTGQAPSLTLDGPADGSIADSRSLTLRGTSDAARVTVSVNGQATEAELVDGSFTAAVTLPEITNRLVVTARSADDGIAVERRTVTALGSRLGHLTDPSGDDVGQGDYTYPTNSAFNPGSLDLTGFDVYDDEGTARFVVTTEGTIANPWGGDGMSTQRVNVYLRDAAGEEPAPAPAARSGLLRAADESAASTPLLPGTNMSGDGEWSHAIVADGRYADARFGTGVYDAEQERVGDAALTVLPAGTIIASVDDEVFEGVDLATAEYQVSMLSGAEEGEGVGGVRPVYSTSCAAGEGCPDFVGPFRFGGGAGDWTDANEARDTVTDDANAIDIISGDREQSEVMDYTAGPVVVPFLALAAVTPEEPEPGETEPPTGGSDTDGSGSGADGSGSAGSGADGSGSGADASAGSDSDGSDSATGSDGSEATAGSGDADGTASPAAASADDLARTGTDAAVAALLAALLLGVAGFALIARRRRNGAVPADGTE
ncbi:family 49 glycosyl hydrolase [Mycetocola reblochoni]|uniref:Dextranase n=2 Tax=Mycetocola reblochoni TaxID=331618 RepID=A0A1R4K9V4_9MICO|nr:family 49 glycosyl hydrolase [Mycetocola reblochoni]RLP71175.1 dextranase [Mycetocola reblochoni]SJN41079.1 hypothetical protein FM119_12400 [Mycetocola reblochoni REB411]